MLHLYCAQTNVMNFLILIDGSRKESSCAAVIDWDLNEAEINLLIENLETDPENTYQYKNVYWTTEDEAFGGTFDRKCIWSGSSPVDQLKSKFLMELYGEASMELHPEAFRG